MLRRTSKADKPVRDVFDAAAHILVVNDDEGACELLCRLLVRAGHRVQRAHNAEQALGQLSVGKISCVVLDLAAGGIGANLKLPGLSKRVKLELSPQAAGGPTRIGHDS